MIGSVHSASGTYSPSSLYRSATERFGGADPRSETKEARPGSLSAQTDPSRGKTKPTETEGLSPEQQRQVEELKRRDAEVRAHEMAHLAAAGSLAMGGASYVYQTGPDGKPYAIGGEVQIDTSPGRTPEESLRKAQQIRSAALAPSDPSAQDLKVAAAAAAMEANAQRKSGAAEDDPANPAPTGETKAQSKRAAAFYQTFGQATASGERAPSLRASA